MTKLQANLHIRLTGFCCLRHTSAYADASLREVGLNLAVATMRKKERCHIKVQPHYGYGDRGEQLLCLPVCM